VRLDPRARVKLDPNAKVEIGSGQGIDHPRPTDEQYRPHARPPTQANVVTDFTVLKSVEFGKGTVVTGWRFANNEQTAPDYQYCYFIQSVDDSSRLGTLAVKSLQHSAATQEVRSYFAQPFPLRSC
jgi:hypothetical protein